MTSGERLSFRRVPPPTVEALEKLVRGISARVGRVLERQGLLVRDLEDSFLTVDSAEGSGVDDLLGHFKQHCAPSLRREPLALVLDRANRAMWPDRNPHRLTKPKYEPQDLAVLD